MNDNILIRKNMRNIRLITIIMLLGITIPPALGQGDSIEIENGGLGRNTITFGEGNWYLFKQKATFSGERLFKDASKDFGLSESDSMMLVSSTADELGFQHFRYQQVHKGIPVESAVYCVHEKDGRVVSANGIIVRGFDISSIPSVSSDSIVAIIHSRCSSLSNQSKSIDPVLVYTRSNDGQPFTARNYRLTYKITTVDSVWYYDAETGMEVKSYRTLMPIGNCHTGSAFTTYNGWQDITTALINSKYYLRDSCRGRVISATFVDSYIHDYSSINNIWNENDWERQNTVSAFWAAEMAYDYFLDAFDRNSYDNNGSKIDVITMEIAPMPAMWHQQEKKIYCSIRHPLFNPLVSLETIGHELTHGIVQHTSNLGNQGEPGALNESFADIFGTMVEFYVEGVNGDYIVGKEVSLDNTGLRNMMNPKLKTHPDTYLGTYWYSGNDNGEFTHANNGVQNYWFYLLAEGGEGENDNGDPYSVQGIGREKAARIAYRNMVYYLNSSCGYADARNGAILSAADLFGHDSQELLSTIAAWDAVGVNDAGSLHYDCETDCESLQALHANNEIPISVAAIHSIESNCQYVANQVPVYYYAGEEILLTNGFYSGDNFSAYIAPELLGSTLNRSGEVSSFCTGRGSDTEDSATSSERISSTGKVTLTVFPNPSMDVVSVASSVLISKLSVYDISGKRLYEIDYPQEGVLVSDIDIHSFVMGIYIIEVQLADNSIVAKRFVKR